MGKIKTQDHLARIIKREKTRGKIVGFTNGCFDILHLGHVRYLNEAKKRCDFLVIGVNSDKSVKKLKGDSRPINPQDARMEIVASLESVDYVTLFNEDTPLKLIKKLTPNVLFKGGDWKENDVVGGEYVKANGGKVRIIPYVDGYSTTRLLKRLKNEKCKRQNEKPKCKIKNYSRRTQA